MKYDTIINNSSRRLLTEQGITKATMFQKMPKKSNN